MDALGPGEMASLEAFAATLLPDDGGGGLPASSEIARGAARRIEQAPPASRETMGLALRWLEWAPVFGLDSTRFSRMPGPSRERVVRAWMESRIAFKRTSVQALRWVCLASAFGAGEQTGESAR